MDRRNRPENPRIDSRTRQMESIVAEHETALLRYATRLVGSSHSAQDVVQNTFIKLFRSWKKGTKPTTQLKAWLYRVTHNGAVDYIRKDSRRRLLHESHATEATAACPDGHHCASKPNDRLEAVMSFVHLLMPTEKQVLLLRLEEGLSYSEIGRVTGRTTGSVGSILHHAVKKLSTAITREGCAL